MDQIEKSKKPLVNRNTLVNQVNVIQVKMDSKRAKGQISEDFWHAASIALRLLVETLIN